MANGCASGWRPDGLTPARRFIYPADDAHIGVGQFGLLFVAMNGHISPGLASLVIQVQVFFTIGLAMRLSGERLQLVQWLALALATAGIGTIIMHTDGSTTLLGLGLILLAAMSWAGGNMTSRQAGQVNMVSYVVWSSLFAVPPLAALCLVSRAGTWSPQGCAAPRREPGPLWLGKRGGTHCLATQHGAGYWPDTRLRR